MEVPRDEYTGQARHKHVFEACDVGGREAESTCQPRIMDSEYCVWPRVRGVLSVSAMMSAMDSGLLRPLKERKEKEKKKCYKKKRKRKERKGYIYNNNIIYIIYKIYKRYIFLKII